jgi:hypothetical protein
MKKAAYPGCCQTPPTAHAGKEYATRTDSSSHPYSFPECPVEVGVESRDVLTQVLRNGARDMLARSVLDEVAMYVAERADLVDEQGHHLVVRNGYLPQRKIMTGIGAVEVQQPRVRDRRPVDEREKFASSILPPYLRKTKSVEELLPWLYLKGISTDGLQARAIRRETLASVERFNAHPRGHRRRGVRRWPQKGRRLIVPSNTRFGNTSFATNDFIICITIGAVNQGLYAGEVLSDHGRNERSLRDHIDRIAAARSGLPGVPCERIHRFGQTLDSRCV